MIWLKGHAAVCEITSSSIRDAEGVTVDWTSLRTGLKRAFVENQDGRKAPYKEAVLQLVRDARLVLTGAIASSVPVQNLQRIYPVMVGVDRRTRTPGIVRFLQQEFTARLEPPERNVIAPLAILGL